MLPVVIDGTPYTRTAWGSLVRPSRASVRFLPMIDYREQGIGAAEIAEDLRPALPGGDGVAGERPSVAGNRRRRERAADRDTHKEGTDRKSPGVSRAWWSSGYGAAKAGAYWLGRRSRSRRLTLFWRPR